MHAGPVPISWDDVRRLSTAMPGVEGDPTVLFTTTHFDGYPAVLIWLDAADEDGLREIVEDSWLARAPKKLAREFLEAT